MVQTRRTWRVSCVLFCLKNLFLCLHPCLWCRLVCPLWGHNSQETSIVVKEEDVNEGVMRGHHETSVTSKGKAVTKKKMMITTTTTVEQECLLGCKGKRSFMDHLSSWRSPFLEASISFLEWRTTDKTCPKVCFLLLLRLPENGKCSKFVSKDRVKKDRF